MQIQTEGTVVSVAKMWWLKIKTKAFRTGPLDGAIFPHVAKIRYTVGEKEYFKRVWIPATDPVPKQGDAVRLLYDEDRPEKAKVL